MKVKLKSHIINHAHKEIGGNDMIRTRVAGIVPMENGFLIMHRRNVKFHTPEEYYTFPGGGLENKETLQECCKREIKEEFGVDVIVKELLYQTEQDKQEEYFFLCEYTNGTIGTGIGPEFSQDPKYADRGEYLPEVIAKEKIEKLLLLPLQVRDMFVADIKKGRFDSYLSKTK